MRTTLCPQIILEASKGSKYYENEVRKEQQVTKKVEAMLANLKKISPVQRASSQEAMDQEVERLESGRVLNRIIVHIDMDAFYASVEMRDNSKLRDVPMAVGSYSMLVSINWYTCIILYYMQHKVYSKLIRLTKITSY